MCVCMYRERDGERERACACVCAREREREGGGECTVCVYVKGVKQLHSFFIGGLIHDVVILHLCSFGNLKSMFSASSSLVPPF